jgi:hypothetical protein
MLALDDGSDSTSLSPTAHAIRSFHGSPLG